MGRRIPGEVVMKNSQQSIRSGRTGGFTLIELLVTVGIMAIVITLTIPAFTGLGRGARVDRSLNGLKTTMSLARQWSITQRDEVYVIFPEQPGDWANIDPDMSSRSYAVYSNREGEYLTEWRVLPEGVILDLSDLNRMEYGLETITWTEIEHGWLGPVPVEKSKTVTKFKPGGGSSVRAIGFRQDGSLVGVGASTRMVEVIEGFVQPDGAVQRTFTREDGRSDVVKVNGLTGLSYVERDI